MRLTSPDFACLKVGQLVSDSYLDFIMRCPKLPMINPSILKMICPTTIKSAHTVSPFKSSAALGIFKASRGYAVGYSSLVNKKLNNLDTVFHLYPLIILFMAVTARIVSVFSQF